MFELECNLEFFFGILFYSILITVSMNLSDQLVIVTCDLVMESQAPSWKNRVF